MLKLCLNQFNLQILMVLHHIDLNVYHGRGRTPPCPTLLQFHCGRGVTSTALRHRWSAAALAAAATAATAARSRVHRQTSQRGLGQPFGSGIQ